MGQEPFPVATTFFRGPVFNDPTWNFRSFDYDRDVERAKGYGSDALDVPPTGLDRFVAGNRKLLLSHGWSDGLIPAQSTVEFYEALVKDIGARRARDNVRLFMAPGMTHCAGGTGPSAIDFLGTIDRWSRPARHRSGSSPPIRRMPRSARGRCARIRKWPSTRAPAARTRSRISAAKHPKRGDRRGRPQPECVSHALGSALMTARCGSQFFSGLGWPAVKRFGLPSL